MNISRLFYSFFTILVAIFFILVGIICIMIPWLATMRTLIILFLLEQPITISLFGIIFLIIGSAIVQNIILSAKHRYYKIRSGTRAITVDETLIQQHLDSYCNELFPNCEVPNQIFLKNNRIHVVANLPYFPLSEQRPLLERMERDLTKSFFKILGYDQGFYLSASFCEQEITSN